MTVDEKRAFAAPLRDQGIDYQSIADALVVSKTTAFRWANPGSDAGRSREGRNAVDVRRRTGCRCVSCGTATGAVDEAGESRCSSCQREAREAASASVMVCGCGSPMLEEAEMCGLCEIEMQHA
jgi:hypothetical protein